MAMIVKFQCDDGEIFRRPLQQEPSFDAIVEVIAACRPEVADLREGFLKYVDDEGDLCTLTQTTFADFLDLQKRINGQVLKLKLTLPKQSKPEIRRIDADVSQDRSAAPPSTPIQPQASMPDQKEDPFTWLWKGKAKGKGKKGKHGKGQAQSPSPQEAQAEEAANGTAPNDQCNGSPKQEETGNRAGPGAFGHRGGPWRLLCTLRVLREVGLLTPSTFSSLAVHWLPFLIKRAAAKTDEINQMAAEGLDPTLEKMLKIIQEQAAVTPGLEQHSTVLAEALNADSERHLGEALVALLRALKGLDEEVQTQFCESLASALLPCLEESCPNGVGPGLWGAVAQHGAPWRLLCTLQTLPAVGLLTASMFSALAVHWLPFLIKHAAAKTDEINQMAAEGLDPTLEKMLKIIQEQAAVTPGLEQHSTVLAEALNAVDSERHLGEALVALLRALKGLDEEVQTQFCESLVSALLPCLEDLHFWSKGKGGGKGKGKHCKGKGKHCKGKAPATSAATTAQREMPDITVEVEESAAAAPAAPAGPGPSCEAEDTWPNGGGEWCGHGYGGPRKLLWTLSSLRDVGVLTPAMFASLVVPWLPFLAHFAERKVEKINRMGAEGLDPAVQKMLEAIQEQAAATPGLEQHSALIAEALSGDNGQRRLGEAILEMLRGVMGLDMEAQSRFCESVASTLLPCLEELHTPKGKGKGKGKKGKHWGKHAWHTMWTGCHATETAEEIGPAAKHDEFEKKVATLLELQIATEEVIRELLTAHNGDLSQVTELLTS